MAIRKLRELPKTEREIIWDTAKAYYENGLSYNDILDNIEHKYGVSMSKGQLSKYINENNIIKGKNEPLKDEVIELDAKQRTLTEQKVNTIEKLSSLSDFDITIMNEVIEDQTKTKSLIASTSSLALIRTNQMLTKNITYEKINKGDGVQDFEPRELNTTDIKNCIEAIDKASITLGVNERHARSSVEVNNTNAQQNIENKQIEIVVE